MTAQNNKKFQVQRKHSIVKEHLPTVGTLLHHIGQLLCDTGQAALVVADLFANKANIWPCLQRDLQGGGGQRTGIRLKFVMHTPQKH